MRCTDATMFASWARLLPRISVVLNLRRTAQWMSGSRRLKEMVRAEVALRESGAEAFVATAREGSSDHRQPRG